MVGNRSKPTRRRVASTVVSVLGLIYEARNIRVACLASRVTLAISANINALMPGMDYIHIISI